MVKISLQNLKDMIDSSQLLTLYTGKVFDMEHLPKHVGVLCIGLMQKYSPIFFLFYVSSFY